MIIIYLTFICVVLNKTCPNPEYFVNDKKFNLVNSNDNKVDVSEKVQEINFKIAELILKAKEKPHPIAETLLMPACREMVKIVLCSVAVSEIS